MKIYKISVLMLIIVMIISSMNIVSLAVDTEFKYEVDSNNYATITAYNGTSTDITIPSTIDGHQVKAIAQHAFDESRNNTKGNILTKVTISEGITSVGDFAFVHCSNLESVKLPTTLTELGDQTFIGCSKLKEINIPSNLKRFKTFLFQETGFTEFTIPDGFEYIGNSDFRLCTNLKKFVVYSKNVEYDSNVFEHCSENLVLYGYPDSTTQKYAESNGLKFADISTYVPEYNGEKTYQGFNVLGTIEIPTINLKYPILEKTTKKALEVSVAKLYPQSNDVINKIGNLVIVGHNYRDGTLFSNIKNLKNNDEIFITDLEGNKEKYLVYKKGEYTDEDTSFYNRDTNGAKEITLSTTTDDGKRRTVIFASNIAKETDESNLDKTDKDNNQENIQKDGNITKEDKTISKKKLPNTGIATKLIIFLILFAIIGTLYKINKKYN